MGAKCTINVNANLESTAEQKQQQQIVADGREKCYKNKR